MNNRNEIVMSTLNTSAATVILSILCSSGLQAANKVSSVQGATELYALKLELCTGDLSFCQEFPITEKTNRIYMHDILSCTQTGKGLALIKANESSKENELTYKVTCSGKSYDVPIINTYIPSKDFM